jgi:hypothetical protein
LFAFFLLAGNPLVTARANGVASLGLARSSRGVQPIESLARATGTVASSQVCLGNSFSRTAAPIDIRGGPGNGRIVLGSDGTLVLYMGSPREILIVLLFYLRLFLSRCEYRLTTPPPFRLRDEPTPLMVVRTLSPLTNGDLRRED